MPRPGVNSSSEGTTSVKGSSRIKNPACLGGWEEGGLPRGSPRKHGESVQTAIRRRLQGPSLGSSCSEVTSFEFKLRCVVESETQLYIKLPFYFSFYQIGTKKTFS